MSESKQLIAELMRATACPCCGTKFDRACGILKEIEHKLNATLRENERLRQELELARKLHWLAREDHIFFSSYNEEKGTWDEGIYPAINCNDVFVSGADAEKLSLEDVDTFIEVCKAFPKYGSIAWCIVKRNLKPWRGFPEAEDIVPQVRSIVERALKPKEPNHD